MDGESSDPDQARLLARVRQASGEEEGLQDMYGTSQISRRNVGTAQLKV